MANPEVEKLKQRTAEYKRNHPRYDVPAPPSPPPRKKQHTGKRLSGDEVCAYCGVKLSTYTATIDHVIPLSRGGTDFKWNLVWCCKRCNKSKGSKLLSEWEGR
jgi:5-methylcytosine-specific restriction endonuclease McrA